MDIKVHGVARGLSGGMGGGLGTGRGTGTDENDGLPLLDLHLPIRVIKSESSEGI